MQTTLALFINLFSRMVLGCSLGDRMRSELVESALSMGVSGGGAQAPLLIHTDRGSQYQSESFRALVKQLFATQSMSRRGNCWDKAVAQSFRECARF